ncbi:hypothetical protein Kuura_017 [Caulobacter phage Kuura]|nr:hypothetical protein Kuura_017 [Caulobacter phage Kuura]
MSLLPKLDRPFSIDTLAKWAEALVAYFEQSSEAEAQPTVPVGGILDWYGPVPAGYLALEGQALVRADYPVLFAQFGTAWGTGSGSTQFELPTQTSTIDGVTCKRIVRYG